MAMLTPPVVLLNSALSPIAMLKVPVVSVERSRTDGRVPREIGSGDTVLERARTDGRVEAASGVAFECAVTDCHVAFAYRVKRKGERSIGRVVAAAGIV